MPLSAGDWSHRTFPDDLHERLVTSGCGGVVSAPSGRKIVWYRKSPSTAEVAFLGVDTVFVDPYSKDFSRHLADLARLSELRISGNDCVFVGKSKEKESLRWQAACQLAGDTPKSRGRGIRKRISKRIGCGARFTTKSFVGDGAESRVLLEKVRVAAQLAAGAPVAIVSVAERVHNHELYTRAPPAFSGSLDVLLTNSTKILRTPHLRRAFDLFTYANPRSQTRLRARRIMGWRFVQEMLPDVRIPESVSRNVFTLLDKEENQAQEIVKCLREKQRLGEVEHLRFELNTAGELTFLVFSFKGARDFSRRCGDVGFWDSTYDTTVFNFKLHAISHASSENNTVAVLFVLTLLETIPVCICILSEYRVAMGRSLPAVFITDGDEAMSSALAASSDNPTHVSCWFHLLQSAFRRLKSNLIGGPRSWFDFVSSFEACREAPDERTFERLWELLLDQYLPSNDVDSRTYIRSQFYDIRRKWATFWVNARTLGSCSQSRSEGFNAVVKAVARNGLPELGKTIQFIFIRQLEAEKERCRSLQTAVSLVGLPMVTDAMLGALARMRLSSAAVGFLVDELRDASQMLAAIEEYTVSGEVRGVTFYSRAPDKSSTYVRSLHDERGCLCMYQLRMGIPCKHKMILAISADNAKMAEHVREKVFKRCEERKSSIGASGVESEPEILTNASKNELPASHQGELVNLMLGIDKRWCQSTVTWGSQSGLLATLQKKKPRDDLDDLLELAGNDADDPRSDEGVTARKGQGDTNCYRDLAPVASKRRSTSRPIRASSSRSSYPTSTDDGGTAQAYSRVVAAGKNIAELTCLSDAGLKTGALIEAFLLHTRSFLEDAERVSGPVAASSFAESILTAALQRAFAEPESELAPLLVPSARGCEKNLVTVTELDLTSETPYSTLLRSRIEQQSARHNEHEELLATMIDDCWSKKRSIVGLTSMHEINSEVNSLSEGAGPVQSRPVAPLATEQGLSAKLVRTRESKKMEWTPRATPAYVMSAAPLETDRKPAAEPARTGGKQDLGLASRATAQMMAAASLAIDRGPSAELRDTRESDEVEVTPSTTNAQMMAAAPLSIHRGPAAAPARTRKSVEFELTPHATKSQVMAAAPLASERGPATDPARTKESEEFELMPRATEEQVKEVALLSIERGPTADPPRTKESEEFELTPRVTRAQVMDAALLAIERGPAADPALTRENAEMGAVLRATKAKVVAVPSLAIKRGPSMDPAHTRDREDMEVTPCATKAQVAAAASLAIEREPVADPARTWESGEMEVTPRATKAQVMASALIASEESALQTPTRENGDGLTAAVPSLIRDQGYHTIYGNTADLICGDEQQAAGGGARAPSGQPTSDVAARSCEDRVLERKQNLDPTAKRFESFSNNQILRETVEGSGGGIESRGDDGSIGSVLDPVTKRQQRLIGRAQPVQAPWNARSNRQSLLSRKRSRPHNLRDSDTVNIEQVLPQPPNLGIDGEISLACPLCVDVAPMNNVANIYQHCRSKHPGDASVTPSAKLTHRTLRNRFIEASRTFAARGGLPRRKSSKLLRVCSDATGSSGLEISRAIPGFGVWVEVRLESCEQRSKATDRDGLEAVGRFNVKDSKGNFMEEWRPARRIRRRSKLDKLPHRIAFGDAKEEYLVADFSTLKFSLDEVPAGEEACELFRFEWRQCAAPEAAKQKSTDVPVMSLTGATGASDGMKTCTFPSPVFDDGTAGDEDSPGAMSIDSEEYEYKDLFSGLMMWSFVRHRLKPLEHTAECQGGQCRSEAASTRSVPESNESWTYGAVSLAQKPQQHQVNRLAAFFEQDGLHEYDTMSCFGVNGIVLTVGTLRRLVNCCMLEDDSIYLFLTETLRLRGPNCHVGLLSSHISKKLTSISAGDVEAGIKPNDATSPFFVEAVRHFKKLKLTSLDFLILPFHEAACWHWILFAAEIAVVRDITGNVLSGKIKVFACDPYFPFSSRHGKSWVPYLHTFCEVLKYAVLYGKTGFEGDVVFRDHVHVSMERSDELLGAYGLPVQSAGNGTDCGVHVVLFIITLMDRSEERHMSVFTNRNRDLTTRSAGDISEPVHGFNWDTIKAGTKTPQLMFNCRINMALDLIAFSIISICDSAKTTMHTIPPMFPEFDSCRLAFLIGIELENTYEGDESTSFNGLRLRTSLTEDCDLGRHASVLVRKGTQVWRAGSLRFAVESYLKRLRLRAQAAVDRRT